MSEYKFPTAFIPHGGGPWPVISMEGEDQNERDSLSSFMKSIGEIPTKKPKFLVVVSAHWEENDVTVHIGKAPKLLFDYGGFPPEAYKLEWPAKGSPNHGDHAISLLEKAGFTTKREKERGFDHGTFIPLMLAFPLAEIPVVQVSLKRGLDPAEHLAIGRALTSLRSEGGFIIASGNSYHNLRKLVRPDGISARQSEEFDAWLNSAIVDSVQNREQLLEGWLSAPAARASHPREEHLIPLMVAAGAAGDDAGRVGWRGAMNGMALSAHYFG